MLDIKNNRLVGVPFINLQGVDKTITPAAIVIHFTGGGTAKSSIASMDANGIGAHVVVDRDGSITQCVPFNKRANHAGISSLDGRQSCNNFTIGIEIANYGALTELESGKFVSWSKQPIKPDNVMRAAHKLINPNGTHDPKQPWETYTGAQVKAVSEIIEALGFKYSSIKTVVGHEDIAPYRKSDPGPAAPMNIWKAALNPSSRASDLPDYWQVNAPVPLNVRGGPGVEYTKIGNFDDGQIVSIIKGEGQWRYVVDKDKGLTGWVHGSYLVDIN